MSLKTSSRQKEIFEALLRHGWNYMQQVLSLGKGGTPEVPPPAVLRNILTDLGPVYINLGQLLSTRPDLLPPDYIETLSQLQADVPPVPCGAGAAIAIEPAPRNTVYRDCTDRDHSRFHCSSP